MSKGRVTGITIPIDGDTTPLGKAIKNINKDSRELQKELRQVNNALKFNPKDTVLLAQKQELLTKEIGNTKNKLDTLKNAQKEVTKAFKDGDISEEQYRDFQRELVTTEDKLKSYKGQLREARSEQSKLAQGLESMGKGFKTVGKGVTEFGKNVSKTVGASATAMTVAFGKQAIDFEKSQGKISTLLDTNMVSMDQVKKSVNDMSKSYGVASESIQESIYGALSAGVDSKDVLKFVESNIKASEASFADLETVIDGTTSIMNAYGKESFDANKIHNIMINTQDKGKISVQQLSEEIGKVIPNAQSLGVNFDELGVQFSLLTKKGVPVTKTTTQINSLFKELGKTGSKADKALKEGTGKGFEQLSKDGKNTIEILTILEDQAKKSGQNIKDMFGSGDAGSGAVTLLSSGTKEYNDLLSEFNNNMGKVNENYEKTDSTARQLAQTQEEVKSATRELGEAMLPTIQAVADTIKELAEKFNGLDQSTKETIGAFIPFLVILGPIIMVIGTLISSVGVILGLFGKLIFVLSGILTPFGAVITVIGLVVGAVLLLRNKWKSALGGMKSDSDSSSKGILGVFGKLWKSLSDIFGKIRNGFSKLFNKPPKVPKIPTPKIPGGGNKRGGNTKWNAKGAIFKSPTIFDTKQGFQGVGEAGPEAILPISKLPKLLGLDNKQSGRSEMDLRIEISGPGSQYLSIPKISQEVERNIASTISHDSRRLSNRPRKIQL